MKRGRSRYRPVRNRCSPSHIGADFFGADFFGAGSVDHAGRAKAVFRPRDDRKVVVSASLLMAVALAAGPLAAVVSVVWLVEAAGLPRAVVLSVAPKSVTAGVAMGVSQQPLADPSLTAVAVIPTGIMSAIIVTPLMNRIGIKDFCARGFAVGIAARLIRRL